MVVVDRADDLVGVSRGADLAVRVAGVEQPGPAPIVEAFIGSGEQPAGSVRTGLVPVTFLPEERNARHGDNNERGDDSDGDSPLDTAR